MSDVDDKDDSVVTQLTYLTYLDFNSVLFDGHRGIACAHILLCFAMLLLINHNYQFFVVIFVLSFRLYLGIVYH